jgi:hypothetical protein
MASSKRNPPRVVGQFPSAADYIRAAWRAMTGTHPGCDHQLVQRVYRYNYDRQRRPPFTWMPGFCCALPAGCCFLWSALLAFLLLVSILTVLRHLI